MPWPESTVSRTRASECVRDRFPIFIDIVSYVCRLTIDEWVIGCGLSLSVIVKRQVTRLTFFNLGRWLRFISPRRIVSSYPTGHIYYLKFWAKNACIICILVYCYFLLPSFPRASCHSWMECLIVALAPPPSQFDADEKEGIFFRFLLCLILFLTIFWTNYLSSTTLGAESTTPT